MESSIYENFRAIVHYHRNKQRDYLEQFGLYYGQPRILITISENENITQSELVELLKVTKESVSISIKRLNQNGLVEKIRDDSDKRMIRLRLSEKGKQITQKSFEGIEKLNVELFEVLTDDEKNQLSILFEKIVQSKEGLTV